jgi:hypothetical protein
MPAEDPDRMNNVDRHADALLDAALRQYSAAEPRPGLEQRMLAAVRNAEQERSRGWSWLDWRVLGATVAVVVLIVALLLRERPQAPQQGATGGATIEAATPPSSGQNTVAANRGETRPRVPRVAQVAVAVPSAKEEAAPHLAVFPTPVEPNAQDATLAYMVGNTDPHVLTALAAASSGPTKPIAIEPITIEPLAPATEPAGDEQQAQDEPKD